jgi:hypothetical protein
MTRDGPTVWIDDAADGGSDAGAWDTAIAHTPHLAAQCRPDEAPAQDPQVND